MPSAVHHPRKGGSPRMLPLKTQPCPFAPGQNFPGPQAARPLLSGRMLEQPSPDPGALTCRAPHAGRSQVHSGTGPKHLPLGGGDPTSTTHREAGRARESPPTPPGTRILSPVISCGVVESLQRREPTSGCSEGLMRLVTRRLPKLTSVPRPGYRGITRVLRD